MNQAWSENLTVIAMMVVNIAADAFKTNILRNHQSGSRLNYRSRYSLSQVEFGAHQVILVRTLESIDRLPEDIKNSNAIFLTVPQAKGLEFDDGGFVPQAISILTYTPQYHQLTSNWHLSRCPVPLPILAVYLINFFQDSEADSEWRVLCSFLEKIREEQVESTWNRGSKRYHGHCESLT